MFVVEAIVQIMNLNSNLMDLEPGPVGSTKTWWPVGEGNFGFHRFNHPVTADNSLCFCTWESSSNSNSMACNARATFLLVIYWSKINFLFSTFAMDEVWTKYLANGHNHVTMRLNLILIKCNTSFIFNN